MRQDIKNFPPPEEPGCLLGQDGRLTEEEVTHLQKLGYTVSNWKALSGQRLVQGYLEGSAKGLIEFDENQMRIIETMRKMGAADLIQKDKVEASDVMSILSSPFKNVEVGRGVLKKRASPKKVEEREDDG